MKIEVQIVWVGPLRAMDVNCSANLCVAALSLIWIGCSSPDGQRLVLHIDKSCEKLIRVSSIYMDRCSAGHPQRRVEATIRTSAES